MYNDGGINPLSCLSLPFALPLRPAYLLNSKEAI